MSYIQVSTVFSGIGLTMGEGGGAGMGGEMPSLLIFFST